MVQQGFYQALDDTSRMQKNSQNTACVNKSASI